MSFDFAADLDALYDALADATVVQHTPAGGGVTTPIACLVSREGMQAFGDQVQGVDITLRYRAAGAPVMARHDVITIGGVAHRLREVPRPILDGSEFIALVEPAES